MLGCLWRLCRSSFTLAEPFPMDRNVFWRCSKSSKHPCHAHDMLQPVCLRVYQVCCNCRTLSWWSICMLFLAWVRTAVVACQGPPPQVWAQSLSLAHYAELSAVHRGLAWLVDSGKAGGYLPSCLCLNPNRVHFGKVQWPWCRLSVLPSYVHVRLNKFLWVTRVIHLQLSHSLCIGCDASWTLGGCPSRPPATWSLPSWTQWICSPLLSSLLASDAVAACGLIYR